MAVSRTYHASVLVLRKRKLGESDLILSMLSGDGSLIEAVAKGARKPTSPFSTRLELFCESEVMLARGRNLDIASEVRLLNAHASLRSDEVALYAAAPVLDALSQTALPNLPIEHLYPMASSSLAHLEEAESGLKPAVTAAFLLKLFALLGVRPHLDACVQCGNPRGFEAGTMVGFSFSDGGHVCDDCAKGVDRVLLEAEALQWASAFLMSTFDEVIALAPSAEASFAVLHFAHQWLRETLHVNLKSLNQLFACGLF